MMKKLLLPMAIFAMLAASCNPHVNDSTQSQGFPEYNLISDRSNPNELAQATEGSYKVTYNISKNTVDLTASDLIISNQKYSFETDTMGVYSKVLSPKVSYMAFSKASNIGKGAKVTNLSGYIPTCYVPYVADLFADKFEFVYSYSQRLQLEYDLDDQYHITTFWPENCYLGQTYITDDATSHSTRNIGYFVQIDFSKKTAKTYVLGMEFGPTANEGEPHVILIEEIPVKFTNSGYVLEAASPKTTIPGKVDDKNAFVESPDYKVTDFLITLVSADMTNVAISFKIAGKDINFHGSSIVETLD